MESRRSQKQRAQGRSRALAGVSAYLDFCLQSPGVQRHVFLVRLFALSQRMSPELFTRSVQRARRYQIISLEILERIAGVPSASMRDTRGAGPAG